MCVCVYVCVCVCVCICALTASQHIQDTETVRVRFNQYKLAALKAKRSGDTDLALQHMRVVKVSCILEWSRSVVCKTMWVSYV